MILQAALLDACCVLNLYATGQIEDILLTLPYRFAMGARARGEARWLKMEQPDEREAVDLGPLFESGLLEEQVLAGARETALFVELSATMDDGEAEAAALVINRGALLVTDDRKARGILAREHPALGVLSTLDLLYDWQLQRGLPNAEVSAVLRRVAARASYAAPRSDPRRPWWLEHTEG